MNKLLMAAGAASVSAIQLKQTQTREPLLTWAPTPKKGAYPVNYFVPNFG